jgi:hypothetical protein
MVSERRELWLAPIRSLIASPRHQIRVFLELIPRKQTHKLLFSLPTDGNFERRANSCAALLSASTRYSFGRSTRRVNRAKEVGVRVRSVSTLGTS